MYGLYSVIGIILARFPFIINISIRRIFILETYSPGRSADRPKMAMEAEAAAGKARPVNVPLGNRHLLK
jgi:hypothetical protein